ncbi:MAG: hypothetical protein WDN72_09665 [Alphaproteobacteria bacterium]
MRRTIATVALCALALSGCDRPDQDRYNGGEVGVGKVVQFGRVVSARKIHITGPKTVPAPGSASSAAGRGRRGGQWRRPGLDRPRGAIAGATLGTLAERELQNATAWNTSSSSTTGAR